jgi:hypothetical protein
VIKYKLLGGAKRDLLPLMMSPPHFGIHSKPFQPRFYGRKGFISSCTSHICTQKVHKALGCSLTIFFYSFAMWARHHQKDEAPNVYMYKNKTHTHRLMANIKLAHA